MRRALRGGRRIRVRIIVSGRLQMRKTQRRVGVDISESPRDLLARDASRDLRSMDQFCFTDSLQLKQPKAALSTFKDLTCFHFLCSNFSTDVRSFFSHSFRSPRR